MSPARYVRILILSTFSLLLIAGGVNFIGTELGYSNNGVSELYRHQFSKIERAGDVDVLFVGDSTLGNAISVDRWHEISGQTALNIALIASQGYEADFNMIKRYLHVARPKNIVMFHNLGALQVKPVAGSFIWTNPDGLGAILDNLSLPDIAKFYLGLEVSKGIVVGAFRHHFNRPRAVVMNDYIKQGSPIIGDAQSLMSAEREGITVFTETPISPVEVSYLGKIAKLCRNEGINCIYAHGPIVKGICEGAIAHIQRMNTIITEIGFKVVNATPQCIAYDELGDALGHIHPTQKTTYTDRYYRLMSQYLLDQVRGH